MITFKQEGNFNKSKKFMNRALVANYRDILDHYGREGVIALSSATPIESGATALSWNYEVHSSRGTHKIVWTNNNLSNGIPVAILIQYGHGTRNGGYVQGIDYINPALTPIFKALSDALWREVTI